GVEDAAVAVVSGPGARVVGAVVHRAGHALGLLDEDDVKVLGYVLKSIPFIGDSEAVRLAEAVAETGEVAVDDRDGRLLLGAVGDELAADHLDEGVVGPLVPRSVVAERVGGRVHADEALA